MDVLSLPVLKRDDPHLKLRVENRKKNVFVTQLEDHREKTDYVNHLPVITESSSGILETGVNTLQKTLVLKKQAELDEVDRQLIEQRQEFKSCMQVLEQRRVELQQKQHEAKQKAAKHEKFLNENELKRHRALKTFQMERQQKESQEREIAELSAQLEQLQSRCLYLKEKVRKYKIFKEYLMKVVDSLPNNYLGYGTDLVTLLIRRFETLSITRQDQLQHLASLTEDLKKKQHSLDSLKLEHNIYKLMANQELSELQTQLDQIKEKNKQREMTLHMHLGQFRDQAEEGGHILMEVKNLGVQCHLSHYGPIEDMDMLTMMDMIKEFILDKADLEKRAMRLSDSGSTAIKGTVPTNTSNKSHPKSPRKNSSRAGLVSSSNKMK